MEQQKDRGASHNHQTGSFPHPQPSSLPPSLHLLPNCVLGHLRPLTNSTFSCKSRKLGPHYFQIQPSMVGFARLPPPNLLELVYLGGWNPCVYLGAKTEKDKESIKGLGQSLLQKNKGRSRKTQKEFRRATHCNGK